MPKKQHRATKRVFLPTAVSVVAALSYAAVGMPGWASQTNSAPRAAVEPVACDHQDASGKGWYQAVYVHRARDKEQVSAAKADAVRQVMWQVDQVFDASARRFGQDDSRRLRFVQDGNCRMDVLDVPVDNLPGRPTLGMARKAAQAVITSRGNSDAATRKRLKRTRMVFFVDAHARGCGVAATPRPQRRADLHTGWAAVSWGCATQQAVIHEMVHQFGVSHCDNRKDQGSDPICRGYDKTPRCNDLMAAQVLDCAKDEFAYFSPRPQPGSPLAKKPSTNVANSPYLIKDQPTPALSVRLARGGQCLAAGEGHAVALSSCDGQERTWKRDIAKDGYFTLALGDKGCLGVPESGSGGRVALVACKEGDLRQEWWMPGGRNAGAARYQILNRQTGQALRVPKGDRPGGGLSIGSRSGGSTFVMADGS